MSHSYLYLLLILGSGLTTCEGQLASGEGDWSIPREEVFDGGPPKDGIPALTSPRFVHTRDIDFLDDDDLVIGMMNEEGPRAYPHAILDWHEIINDELDGNPVSLTYCPLTGSGIAWDGQVSNQRTTFGVSGMLYTTNLIAYDRATDSYWSQMKLECVSGEMIGTRASVVPAIETTWKTWREWYPGSGVISAETGYSRRYGQYPYGEYKSAPYLLFPVENEDARLHRKERVFGIIGDTQVKAYRIDSFSDTTEIIGDRLDGTPVVIVGNGRENFVAAYERTLNDGSVATFQPVNGAGPEVLMDDRGTTWDIFGRGVDGPGKGQQLKPTRSFVAYWFAWAAFYPEVELYSKK